MNRERLEELLELESASELDAAAARELDAACAADPEFARLRAAERRMVALLRSTRPAPVPRDLAAGILHKLELEDAPAAPAVRRPAPPAAERFDIGAWLSRVLGFETLRWAAACAVLVASGVVIRNNLNPAVAPPPAGGPDRVTLTAIAPAPAQNEVASAGTATLTAAGTLPKSSSADQGAVPASPRRTPRLPDPEADPHREFLIALVSSGARPSPSYHDGPVMRTLDGMTAEEIAPGKVGHGSKSEPKAPDNSDDRSINPSAIPPATGSAPVLASADPGSGERAVSDPKKGLSNIERLRAEVEREATGVIAARPRSGTVTASASTTGSAAGATAPVNPAPANAADSEFQRQLVEFRTTLAGSAAADPTLTPEDSARIERIFTDLDQWLDDVGRRENVEIAAAPSTVTSPGASTAGVRSDTATADPGAGSAAPVRAMAGYDSTKSQTTGSATGQPLRRRAETEIARYGGILIGGRAPSEAAPAPAGAEVVRARIGAASWPALRAGLLGLGIQPAEPSTPETANRPVTRPATQGAVYSVRPLPAPVGEPSVVEIEITIPKGL